MSNPQRRRHSSLKYNINIYNNDAYHNIIMYVYRNALSSIISRRRRLNHSISSGLLSNGTKKK